MSVVRQDVQEGPHEIEVLASDVGDLEYRAYPLTDELSRSIDGVLTILNENWDFPCARRFQYPRELRNGILKDLRRANINFSNDYHNWDVQCKSNP